MQFVIQEWTLKRLIDEYDSKRLVLDPPYQRNAIWTLAAQQQLVDTILAGKPMPNFFLLQAGATNYEIVDGQQRARTIIGYWRDLIPDKENLTIKKRVEISGHNRTFVDKFLQYRICVVVISELRPDERIEEYYALVNSTGLRLNRPELKRAEHFSTRFLSLITSLAGYPKLQQLKIFSGVMVGRMNDIDFVSELVAIIKFGLSDKKEKVDELFEDDITEGDERVMRKAFGGVIDHLALCDAVVPIRRTRYRQKNDFYTLFHLLLTINGEEHATVEGLYRVLCKLGPYIKPSQLDCEPLKRYAFNCVTQSNSKHARTERYEIMRALLLNETAEPNGLQAAVLQFMGLEAKAMVRYGRFLSFDWHLLRDLSQPDLFEVEEIE